MLSISTYIKSKVPTAIIAFYKLDEKIHKYNINNDETIHIFFYRNIYTRGQIA